MKLSRTVSYALRATVELAQANSTGPVPCSRLAAEGDMPERFLLQILRTLVNSDILRSTRGVEGGYSLVRPPNEISLLDLIEAIDGPLDHGVPEEILAGPGYNLVTAAVDKIAATSRQELGAIKLSQLMIPPK